MATIAKTLMDIYYDEARAALDANDYEVASAYSDAEAMVNNLAHGIPPGTWIPRFAAIMRERAAEGNSHVAEHFQTIAELAEGVL
jgi:hypothetical protein